MRIPFTADPTVLRALDSIGRTEDVQLSPSGRRLALVGLLTDCLLVLDVCVDADGDRVRVHVTRSLEVTSPALDHPHGMSWLDEDTVVVASRLRGVVIFRLPSGSASRVTLEPLRIIGDDRGDLVTTPGSVSVFPIGRDLVELLVCSNFVHHVSRHLLDRRDGYAVLASESLISAGLGVPDGVAHSRSGHWIAISNHDGHAIHVYRNTERLHDGCPPDGVLRGIAAPHGLVFTPDDRWIVAADADAPFVRVFNAPDANWDGARDPMASLQIVSDADYDRGHFQPGMGGPKGVDLTQDGRVMVATCNEERLAFFDMRPTLGTTFPGPAGDAAHDEQVRRFLLRYLAAARSRVDQATEAIRRTSEREVQLLRGSWWWRITAPIRRVTEPLRLAHAVARHRFRRMMARDRQTE